MSDVPRGKMPTWDFYGGSPRQARVLSYAQAALDGAPVDGAEDEVKEGRAIADRIAAKERAKAEEERAGRTPLPDAKEGGS